MLGETAPKIHCFSRLRTPALSTPVFRAALSTPAFLTPAFLHVPRCHSRDFSRPALLSVIPAVAEDYRGPLGLVNRLPV